MGVAVERQGILLESGTNEIELIEFYLGSQSFGINVHKLREIIPYDESRTTVLPESPPSMVGSFLVRGSTIPLIDLKIHLNKSPEDTATEQKANRQVVLVCEFNRCVNGFLVDGVNQIHRMSWKDLQPISSLIGCYKPRFTGSFNIEDREILIVDLEHIIAELDPGALQTYSPAETADATDELSRKERRGTKRLMLAEDSAIIRDTIIQILADAGYEHISSFIDGKVCFDAIQERKHQNRIEGKPLAKGIDLLISDIEMPKMDGLTLCRQIKEDPALKDIPVIMFSSLITEQMAHHCDQVGADGYTSKPQIAELVEMIDNFLLK